MVDLAFLYFHSEKLQEGVLHVASEGGTLWIDDWLGPSSGSKRLDDLTGLVQVALEHIQSRLESFSSDFRLPLHFVGGISLLSLSTSIVSVATARDCMI